MNSPGKRVLVAEDSPTIRGYLRRTLLEMLHAPIITEVGDGQAAMDTLPTLKPEILITDLQMPRLDGREFLRRAKAEGHLEGVHVLVLSSSISPELRAEFLGSVQFLRKPATAEDIKAALLATFSPTGKY
jgi:two-component system response regulator YesN